MKRIILSLALIFTLSGAMLFSQTNVSVPVSDSVYEFIEIAQTKGLCRKLNGYKPYTKKQIIEILDEINDNTDLMTEKEQDIAREFLMKYSESDADKKNFFLFAHISNDDEDVPVTFNYRTKIQSVVSSGFYSKADYNSWGIDNLYDFSFDGDISKAFSYRVGGILDLTSMPLKYLGDYFIGYDWYGENVSNYLDGLYDEHDNPYPEPTQRKIKKYLNTSYLPYSYKKPWSGQMYLLSNLSADGLEGWPMSWGISGTIEGEIRTSLVDDKINLGFGRISREIAGMDNGSSLVLNSNAQPFMAIDSTFKLFDFLKFYAMTGILEYPNQTFINADSLPASGNDDAFFYQNAFSLNMVEVDYKGWHVDFGGTCVWPKRFELGYMFPLISYVEYQNHIGDFDNLSLFGDLKYTKDGLGSVWGSLYLDEINGLNNNPIKYTRAMFAIQGGIKYVIPKLPFASISLRYTKIEPYCYTHHSINYTPWYSHYISENYTNNGEPLGYYLPPNSDEFLLSFKIRPASNVTAGASYQLIRHGADYGSQQVPGSSLYSEMSNVNRSDLQKYFLHDGAYNWNHILSAGGSVILNTKYPVSVYGNAGLLYSYYTIIDSEKYDRSVYGNNGNCKDVDFKTPYEIADNDEYPNVIGGVITIGVEVRF